MRSSLRGVRARVERIAAQWGTDEPPPDDKDPQAHLLWAIRRYGLAALVAEVEQTLLTPNSASSQVEAP
jgi:hypothetical protein